MAQDIPTIPVSKAARWSGYVLSALAVAALVMSAVMKLMKPVVVVQGFAKSGFTEAQIVPLGIVELACALVYLVPRTAVLGAILVSAYSGGIVVTCYRTGEAWIPGVILGILAWGGLFLRDRSVRSLIPFRK